MAAFEQPKYAISAKAGQDFVLENRYHGVRQTEDGIKIGAKALGAPLGVLYNCEPIGVACKVVTEGIAIVAVGAEDLKLGDKVKLDDTGKVVKFVDADSAVEFFGIMQDNATAGALGAVLLR